MSALRIFATANPSSIGTPVLPMAREDALFWKLLKERRESPLQERER